MAEWKRRDVLKSLGATAAAVGLGETPTTLKSDALLKTGKMHKHIAVIGAGAFGGWTALNLLNSGAKVTLVDAWGPGNSRASSGGETRVIRGTYGKDAIYTRMTARALKLWKEFEHDLGQRVFHRTGVLWLTPPGDDFARSSIPALKESGIPYEELDAAQAARRWPQIDFNGLDGAVFEPEAGFLTARRACEMVLDRFRFRGGEYLQAEVEETWMDAGEARGVKLNGDRALKADVFVFACGPWLGKLFPDVIGKHFRVTRQEVYFFGPPAGDLRFNEDRLPIWIEKGEHLYYGLPGNQYRGFKIADDTRGPDFDPTNGERFISADVLAAARKYMERRFPGMKGAPLVESRVCQYEQTPDAHFILDRHPQAENLWLLGGGSGHGFKHGPAMGELAAAVVLGTKPPEEQFLLNRFK